MTFAADTSNCYWVRALYKIKIGLVRPKIYLIFFTALRLSRSGRKITIINSLGRLRQSSPLSHSTSAGAIEGMTKVTTVHARILSNRVCFYDSLVCSVLPKDTPSQTFLTGFPERMYC